MDAELAASIARLQQARADIGALLRHGAPADAPAGFASSAARFSQTDSSILHIYARLYDGEAMADLRRMVEVDAAAGAVGREINALPANADEASRQRLAELLAPTIAQNLIDYPWLSDPAEHLSRSVPVTQQTFTAAVTELYNAAQLDVLSRAGVLARSLVHSGLRTNDDPDQAATERAA